MVRPRALRSKALLRYVIDAAHIGLITQTEREDINSVMIMRSKNEPKISIATSARRKCAPTPTDEFMFELPAPGARCCHGPRDLLRSRVNSGGKYRVITPDGEPQGREVGGNVRVDGVDTRPC